MGAQGEFSSYHATYTLQPVTAGNITFATWTASIDCAPATADQVSILQSSATLPSISCFFFPPSLSIR
jgi:hypothetical protein